MRCKAKMLDIAFFMVYNDKVNGVAEYGDKRRNLL